MKKRCLYCYGLLKTDDVDFHAACSKKMFGTLIPPELPYSEDNMEQLAELVIKSQTTVTGGSTQIIVAPCFSRSAKPT